RVSKTALSSTNTLHRDRAEGRERRVTKGDRIRHARNEQTWHRDHFCVMRGSRSRTSHTVTGIQVRDTASNGQRHACRAVSNSTEYFRRPKNLFQKSIY